MEQGHEVEIGPAGCRAFLPLGPRVAEHVVSLWRREAPGRVGAVSNPTGTSSELRAMEEHYPQAAEQINSKGFDVLYARFANSSDERDRSLREAAEVCC